MESMLKKPPTWLCLLFYLPSLGLMAQDLTNDGAQIHIQNGATVTIEAGLINQGTGQILNDGSLSVSGDLTNNSSQNLSDGSGTVLLIGSSTQNIGGSQTSRFFDLDLDNAAGLTLQQDIQVDNELGMLAGDLNLNGNVLVLGETASIQGETDANRIFGASGSIETTRDLGAPSGTNIGNLGLELTSAVTLGVTRITRAHASQAVGSGSSIERSFDIVPGTNANLDATLRMYYFPSELNGQTAANLSLFRLNSGATNWTAAGGVSDVGGAYVEQSGLDAMAFWTLSADGTTGLDRKPSVAVATFPNPLSAGESLQITGLEAGSYTVSLFDVRGRQVVQRELQSVSAGTPVSLALPVLTEGVYTLRLENPNFRPAMGKLIIH